MVWLPLHSFKLFIPGKLTPVSAKPHTHTHTLSAPLALTHTHTHTNIHTISLTSNINFSFLRSCGAFKASEVTSRSNFQAKDTSSFAQNQLFHQNRTVLILRKEGGTQNPATLKVEKKRKNTPRGCTWLYSSGRWCRQKGRGAHKSQHADYFEGRISHNSIVK